MERAPELVNVFTTLEEDDAELNYSVLESEDDLILLAAVSSFMRRSLNRVNGYFEATIHHPCLFVGGI